MSLLSFPVLAGLNAARNAWFVPFPADTYVPLSAVRLDEWPRSVEGVFSIGMRDVPNSFFTLIWTASTVIQVLLWFTFDRWELPKIRRKGVLRSELMWLRAKQKLRWFLMLTVVMSALCLPGLRVFEVLHDGQLCRQGYFDQRPQCFALSGLEQVRHYRYGRVKGLVGWDLHFRDGMVYTLHGAPTVEALALLTQRPGVTSNVSVQSGRVFVRRP